MRIASVIRIFVLIRRKIAVTGARHVAARAGRLCAITARIVLGVQGGLVDVDDYALFLIGCLGCIHSALSIDPKRFFSWIASHSMPEWSVFAVAC